MICYSPKGLLNVLPRRNLTRKLNTVIYDSLLLTNISHSVCVCVCITGLYDVLALKTHVCVSTDVSLSLLLCTLYTRVLYFIYKINSVLCMGASAVVYTAAAYLSHITM